MAHQCREAHADLTGEAEEVAAAAATTVEAEVAIVAMEAAVTAAAVATEVAAAMAEVEATAEVAAVTAVSSVVRMDIWRGSVLRTAAAAIVMVEAAAAAIDTEVAAVEDVMAAARRGISLANAQTPTVDLSVLYEVWVMLFFAT